ncbi:riboflavin synthase [Fulvivirgaceae bacterium BMA12]|uniref:Riboflavin synthase n=1 Tax=Agaribacillus aureus TaxID=3051825 RepID=A0ABT8L872_9BACT|nr:riboflavin synthase [Fulvivirgaceae bacterium BMA12]
MFTGIIEQVGEIEKIVSEGSNVHFTVKSSLIPELRVDQSIAHNGVCLTVTKLLERAFEVTAVSETLLKSNMGRLVVGDKINLERCMPATGRFDGHIVQGHVDQTGICTGIADQDGSWIFDFEFDVKNENIVVEKGSICVNGVSLTCFNVTNHGFSVAIIPYTFQHTNFHQLKVGDEVNLEFDIIGKYVKQLLNKNTS